MNPLLEEPEPDDSENDDGEYRPYFARNPLWSADQVGSDEN
jgi:hypothetical protein